MVFLVLLQLCLLVLLLLLCFILHKKPFSLFGLSQMFLKFFLSDLQFLHEPIVLFLLSLKGFFQFHRFVSQLPDFQFYLMLFISRLLDFFFLCQPHLPIRTDLTSSKFSNSASWRFISALISSSICLYMPELTTCSYVSVNLSFNGDWYGERGFWSLKMLLSFDRTRIAGMAEDWPGSFLCR